MAIPEINTLPEIPTLGDPNFSEKMFTLASAMRDMVLEYNGSNTELNVIYDDISTKHSEIDLDANRASEASSSSQRYANDADVSRVAAQTAVNSAESARDAAVLAASEVGALEVAKMQSYNNEMAMAYFELNPL